jgi:hypothetical protein
MIYVKSRTEQIATDWGAQKNLVLLPPVLGQANLCSKNLVIIIFFQLNQPTRCINLSD